MKLCEAKNRKGEPCQRPGVGAGGRCRFHGGASPVGLASPHFITGRYSRHLPVRLAARCAEARADRALLTLRGEIALIAARTDELLSQLSRDEADGEPGPRIPGGGPAMTPEGREMIRERDADIWREIAFMLECSRRLKVSEWRRLDEMRQTLTAEELSAMSQRIGAIIRQHVHDPESRRLIAIELERLANQPERGEDETEN